MTARFAGSRSLDERRRRWLATNEAEGSPRAVTGISPLPRAEQQAASDLRITHFPLRKIISPKGWKIALLCLLAFLLGAAILTVGAVFAPRAAAFGPGWSRLFDAAGGPLARLYCSGLLLLSGQFALLIWWARSRSLRDFDGQYRLWLWAAGGVILAAIGLAGEWHWVLSDLICWCWSARFPQREVLCWMIPTGTLGLIALRKMRADARGCRSSTTLLWLTAASCLAAAVFRLEIDRTGWPESTRRLVGASLEMLACVGLFSSLLAHARFVIHYSAEPPENRPAWTAKLIGLLKTLGSRLPKPSFKFLWPKKDPKAESTAKPAAKRKSASAAATEPAGEAKSSKTKSLTKGRKPAATQLPEPKTPAIEPAAAVASVKEPSPPVEKSSLPKPVASVQPPAKPVAKQPAQNPPARAVPSAKAEPSKPAAKAPPAPAAKPALPKPAPEPPKPSPPQGDDFNDPDEDSANADSEWRVDDPLDRDALKGLSKKERRKLRKQHKDAQRDG